MPIAQFYLVEGAYADEAVAALLVEASHFYAATLYPDMPQPPVDRIRILVIEVKPQRWATGGKLIDQGGAPAPYFVCHSLTGRSRVQLDALMAGMTELLCRHLECPLDVVRGRLVTVAPEDWWIAGRPAASARREEVARRS